MTDPHDKVQDERSEARYDDGRPEAEPDPREVAYLRDHAAYFGCIVDESAGFRG